MKPTRAQIERLELVIANLRAAALEQSDYKHELARLLDWALNNIEWMPGNVEEAKRYQQCRAAIEAAQKE